MTYKTLLDKLSKLNQEQLNMDVTIYIHDEYYPATRLFISLDSDVLDDDHPVIMV